MSKKEKQVILVHSIFYIIQTMFTSFLNVYLYAYTKSFLVMTYFVIVRMSIFPFCSIIGAKLTKKHSPSLSIGIGLGFNILSLLISLSCTNLFIINPYYSLIVALVCGLGFGFFWFGMNLTCQVVPTNESRSTFISYKTFFANITSLIAPLISTFIIRYSKSDLIGYRNILILVVILSVIVTLLSSKIKTKADLEDFTLLECIKFKDENYKQTMLNTFFFGINDALFLTLTGVLVSNAAGSGSLYSELLTYFSILTIILSRILPWCVKKIRVKKAFLITALFNISSTIVLVLIPNVYGAIYYGIAHSIYSVYEHMNGFFLGQCSSLYQNKTEVITARQTYNSLGRIVGMFFIVLCYYVLPETIYFKFSVIVCSLSPLVVVYLANKMIKRIY